MDKKIDFTLILMNPDDLIQYLSGEVFFLSFKLKCPFSLVFGLRYAQKELNDDNQVFKQVCVDNDYYAGCFVLG